MNGELSTTQLSATLDLSLQLVRIDKKDIDSSTGKLREELAQAQSSELGCTSLRDPALLVPVNRTSDAQLAGKLLGRLSQDGKAIVGNLDS
jgi:hypothetical protein